MGRLTVAKVSIKQKKSVLVDSQPLDLTLINNNNVKNNVKNNYNRNIFRSEIKETQLARRLLYLHFTTCPAEKKCKSTKTSANAIGILYLLHVVTIPSHKAIAD